jgi:hypothetical protein
MPQVGALGSVATPQSSATADAGGQADRTGAESPTSEAFSTGTFTLVDAEGEFIEVVGAAALRSTFERIFSAKHLSPGQILVLWEANKSARHAIGRSFGAGTLSEAVERVQAARAARAEPPAGPAAPGRAAETPAPGEAGNTPEQSEGLEPAPAARQTQAADTEERSDAEPSTVQRGPAESAEWCEPPAAATPHNVEPVPTPNGAAPPVAVARERTGDEQREGVGAKPRAPRPQRSSQTRAKSPAAVDSLDDPSAAIARANGRDFPSAAPELVLTIAPGWGDQKVFQQYRAALIAAHNRSNGNASEIMRFRLVNTAVETRLRAKLPERIAEIDAIYALAPLAEEKR